MNRVLMPFLLTALFFACSSRAADVSELLERARNAPSVPANYEIVGVAKVGDGSPVARAWSAYPATRKAAEKAAAEEADRKMREAFGGKNPFKDNPFSSSIGGSAEVRSASTGSSYGTGPDPVHWIVQLKVKASEGFSCTSGYRLPDNDVLYSFMRQSDGMTTMGWIGIGKLTDSSLPRYNPEDVLKNELSKLAKSAHPLTSDQQAKTDELLKAHNPRAFVNAWKKVEANLADKPALREFVDAYFQHGDDSTRTYWGFLALLTPQQKRILNGNAPTTARFEEGGPNGKLSGTLVVANDTKTLSLTLQNMLVSTAVEKVVARVNEDFEAQIAAPAVDPALASKRISCKLVLTSADTALAKLANAAGCVLETSPKGAKLKAK